MSDVVRRLPVRPDGRPTVQTEMAVGAMTPTNSATVGGLSLMLPAEILDVIVQRVKAEVTTAVSAPEPWVNVAEAAEHLSCKPQRIYDLVSNKDSGIPHRKEGSRLLFKRSRLDAWMDRGARR